MMRLLRWTVAAVATASIALAACRSTTAPGRGTPETFLLRSVDGAGLPVGARNPAGEPRDLAAELLYLYPDGTFLLSTGLLPPGRLASEVPGESVERRGRYTREKGRLTMRFTCASADTACPASYVGTLAEGRAAVREANGLGAVRVYERGYEI
jgi:hypothetical protein